MCTRKNLAVSLVLAISMAGVSYGAGGNLPGDGLSESTAYQIEDLADFDVFADPCNSATYWASGVYTKLVCDPNLAGRPYTTAVIAPDTSTDYGFQGVPFAGIFDGNDHIVSNLTIDTAGAGNDYLGLFGSIEGSSAEVKNLGLENVDITGGAESWYLGGLCGYNANGTITNSYATGAVTGGDNSWYLGGLCGYNSDGTITNCYATGSVTGGDYSNWLGGLCGDNSYGTISNCYATGSVTGEYHFGGLCGENYGTITNCYATGLVTGYAYLGGLCGENYGTITNCYATGSVTGDVYLGGLCGGNYSGTITNCYFYLFSGPDNSLGTALNDLQMQDAVSFAGFDFAGNSNDGEDDYWTIVSGHCPRLTWQTDDGPLVPSPPVTTLSGSGYSYNPFQINSYADFTEFRTNSSLRYGYYILTSDIDLSGETFTTAVIDGFFGGHFDGNGHIICNITIDTAGADNDYLGLFSKISASVNDLSIENINITGGADSGYLGGLCGHNYYGTITNCYAAGSIIGGGCLGGLCGYNDYGTIADCYAAGAVSGRSYLGGLCGLNHDGTITNCYAAGSIIGGGYLGGLCGYNNYSTIANCYATGSVTGDDRLGGLCGYNPYGTITNCYATGSITGDDYLGGLCGLNYEGAINNCYATGSVTGGDNSHDLGGLCGYNESGAIIYCFWNIETGGPYNGIGTPKTTEEMQMRSTFTDAGWDFMGEDINGTDDFWRMCVDGIDYPKLLWQFLAGDFVCRDGVNLIDFAVLAETWGLSSGQAGYNELCDLIDDDTIDLNDLAVFVENWLAGK
ncbi:MAG: hypothetical protein KAJ52_01240 [Sedimentisphaerales bacterium]|nr:hypothetical protein [Sedimentisphaerales bacterium]